MKYQREDSGAVIAEIEPKLLIDNDRSRANFILSAQAMMTTFPSDIFVYTARDSNTNEVKAFVIAQVVKGESYVWMAQTWSDPSNDWTVADKILIRLKLWTLAVGRSKLRGETKRKVKAFFRRFSFNPVSQIVEYEIPESFLEGF